MQCRYDKEKLARIFESEEFQNLGAQTQKMIVLHLNVKELKKKVIEEEEEMCKAYRELVKDWKREGREEGREEGRMDARIEAVKSFMKALGISSEQAMDILAMEREEREICEHKLLQS